jgi:hypothetical protein
VRIQKREMNYYIKITLSMNVISIIMGILYFIVGSGLLFGIIFGIILVGSWLLDIGLIFIDDFTLKKGNKIGKAINRLGYAFIFYQIIAVLVLAGGLFLLNADWATPFIQYFLVFVGFFGFFILGTILSYANMKGLNRKEVWKFE